ncbi:MAG: hypothetical protein GY906_02960 [bacterium]|nr:hypothetical protein [bacterium]
MGSECRDAFDAAVSDDASGASEIERALVDRLLSLRADWRLDDLHGGARKLCDAKAAMANLTALSRDILSCKRVADAEELLVDRQRLIIELPHKLAENAGPVLQDCMRLVTLSRSSAVASVVLGLANGGWGGGVVVLDGSPSGRGQDQAEWLATQGLTVVSQPDATASRWLDDRDIKTGVVVGADAISESWFLNAAGSNLLFELAERRRLHRVMVAETVKLVDDARLERMMLSQEMAHESSCGRSWNPFEAVSNDLVAVWVSERGVHRFSADGWRMR